MVDNTNFKYHSSKLLKLVYDAGKSGLINEEERVCLKGKIKILLAYIDFFYKIFNSGILTLNYVQF
jgi:hypothetical protein